jgi:DNA repair photolyase
MNKTEIEWVKNPDGTKGYTWNPVTGCLHNCWYCYAAKIANRFGESNNSKSKIHELVYHDGTIIDLRTEINDPIDCRYLPVGLVILIHLSLNRQCIITGYGIHKR